MNKKQLLFLCSELPFPPKTGSALRNFGLWRQLNLIYDCKMLCVTDQKFTDQNIECIQRERSPIWKRLLFPLRPYLVNGYSKNIETQLREKFVPHSILWVSRLALAQYIPIAKKIGYRIVLDEHNIESDYYLNAIKRMPHKWLEFPLAWQLTYWEAKFCSLADTVIVTSQEDANRLKKLCKVKQLNIVPNCLDDNPVAVPVARGRDAITKLLFVGTLDYAPNEEGIIWFLDSIWPHLSTHKIKLSIIGRRPSNAILRTIKTSGAELHSNVADLAPFYQNADIAIVPLLAGGGTRLKILEAFAAKKAVVSTPQGAEGLDIIDGKNIMIAETPKEFVAAILKLKDDQLLYTNIIENAFATIESKYRWPLYQRTIQRACETTFS